MPIKAGYKQTELGIIPEGWNVIPITSILEKGTRITYGVVQPGENVSNGVLFIRGGDIFAGKINEVTLRNISISISKNYKRTILQGGEILISLVGYPGESAIVPAWLAGANIARQVALIRLNKDISISAQYICHFLLSGMGRSLLLREVLGSAQQVINLKDINKLVILLPKEKIEQSSIATALSDTDTLIENLEKLIAKKKVIKQGTMQQLLTGKKRLPGFSGKWEVKKLGEIADFYKGKGLPKSEITTNGKYKCIHYGELFTTYSEKIIKIVSHTDMKDALFLSKTNDVLMPTSDVTPNGLATASCVNEDGVILGGDVLVIRSHESALDGIFLSYGIRQNKKQIMQLVSGSTVYHLYGSDMKKYEFNIPPTIEEQSAIANILSDMDAEIKSMQQKRDKYAMLKQGMMQQLLTGKIRLI